MSNSSGLFDFGQAIKFLEEGKMLKRIGWNGKGMFIFMQVPSDINIGVVPNMTSLPQSVKDEFMSRYEHRYSSKLTDHLNLKQIKYRNQLAMVYPDNTIYGWLASPSDILAKDWSLY